MAINNTSLQQWKRMEAKRLDAVFLTRIRHGMGCTPFEAECMLKVLHETYSDFFDVGSVRPGQILVTVISAEAKPQESLEEAAKVTVRLTLDGPEDLEIRRTEGVVGLRHHRMERMAVEAFQQGGLLTLEDLALRLFNCGRRTLCTDLATMRSKGIDIPLRSTIKDMGRTVSHRQLIVTKWLGGMEYSEVARATRHSVASVKGYVSRFKRIAALQRENVKKELLPYLAGVSPALAREYLAILEEARIAPHRKKELADKKKAPPKV